MPSSGRFPALGYPDFRRWVLGAFLSNLGGNLQAAALFWQLDALTHRAAAVGYVGLIRVVPLLAFGLFAGHVADRYDRSRILLLTQSGLGVVALALGWLSLTGTVTVGAIYVLIGLNAAIAACDGPARQSIVANLVPTAHYANAASLNGIQWRLGELLGPVLAGLLIAGGGSHLGPGACYLLNALSFAAILYAVVRLPRMPRRAGGGGGAREVFASIADGVRFLRRTLVVRNAMWIDFWGTFVAGASALLPYFARAELKVGPQLYGVLVASQGLGAMVASSWLAWRPVPPRPGTVVISMIALFGLFTVGLGLSPNFWLATLCLAGVGATDMVSTVMRQTIRQIAVPDEMRGRLSSIGMIFQVSGPQLGDFEAAKVADATSARFSFALGGLATLFVAGWYHLRGPALRDYEYSPPTPNAPPS